MSAPSTEARPAGAPPARRVRRRLQPASVVVLLLVAVLSLWHAREASQHLLTDRDPGVYVTTARWLATEGTLLVDPAVGPFAGHPDLVFEEQGWNLDDRGRLEPQFLHLLPVLLAAAHLAGGDRLMLVAPVAIAGLALLAFHVYALRVLRPWWAAAATAALAVSMPWVHVTRDAFSETLVVLLLFGGLAVLWDAQTRCSPSRAGAAGLLLGAVAMARVDGFVALLPLLAFVAVWLVASRQGAPGARQAVDRTAAALVLGLACTVAVALLDLTQRSTWYLDDLGGLLLAVAAGFVTVVVVGGAAVAAAARRARAHPSAATPSRSDGSRWSASRLAPLAALAVVAVFALAWFVRPAVSTVTGAPSAAVAALEQREGLTPRGVRRYSEHSVDWLRWYLGPVALVAGVAGLALAAHHLVDPRRRDLRLLPFLAVFATISALYLWRPSIVPDHVWVMRRYATVTIPGLLLLAALAGQWVKDRLVAGRHRTVGVGVAGALVAATVGFPLATLVPVAGATTQEGMLGKVRDVCSVVGADGALVVLPGRDLELIAGQTFRSFCGVPVAIATPALGRDDVAALAAAWAAEGRTLHLLGHDPADVEALAGRAPELVAVVPNDEQVELTLTERPDDLEAVPFSFAVANASPPAGDQG